MEDSLQSEQTISIWKKRKFLDCYTFRFGLCVRSTVINFFYENFGKGKKDREPQSGKLDNDLFYRRQSVVEGRIR